MAKKEGFASQLEGEGHTTGEYVHLGVRGRSSLPKTLMEERAQVSVELIIVIAALIAVAIIMITQLQSTAKKGSAVINAESRKVWELIEGEGKK